MVVRDCILDADMGFIYSILLLFNPAKCQSVTHRCHVSRDLLLSRAGEPVPKKLL